MGEATGKKKQEPGGYVTTSRWNLVLALLLLVGSIGVVWYFVATFTPPDEEEAKKEETLAGKKAPVSPAKKPPAKRTAAVPPGKKPAPKPKAPAPPPKPVVVTRAFQDGVSPDPGYKGTQDTYLFQSDPESAKGNQPVCIVDGDDPGGTGRDAVALFRWDLADVPRHASVKAVKLVFQVSDISSETYKVYGVTRSWTERGASWRKARRGKRWDRSGGDRDGRELGTILGKGATATVTVNAAGVALVQEWVKDPDRNYGFMFAPDGNQSNGLDLHSREASNANRRPRLEITYAVPPGP